MREKEVLSRINIGYMYVCKTEEEKKRESEKEREKGNFLTKLLGFVLGAGVEW